MLKLVAAPYLSFIQSGKIPYEYAQTNVSIEDDYDDEEEE